MTQLKLKRAYEPQDASDGFRVYVDRLWPRGLSHATFHYDLWAKQIAPSDELRHWFHDNPDARWVDFENRYREELLASPEWSGFVAEIYPHPVVTLIYSSHDEKENNALVLESVLRQTFPDKFQY